MITKPADIYLYIIVVDIYNYSYKKIRKWFEPRIFFNQGIYIVSYTVPLETTEPCARGKTSSLPNVFTANSPRWDENRNRGKDESNRKPR